MAGRAALEEVARRRAAVIHRRELADTDIDPSDLAVGEARDRTGHGAPLDEPVRRDMEAHFGADFRRVRIHTDAVAARAAAALNASAFTLGEDIFFAAGAFAPTEEAGQRLLVHELTHVVQSQQGRVPTSGESQVSRPTDALEQEAATAYDRIATRVAALDERLPRESPPLPSPRMVLRAPVAASVGKKSVRTPHWLSLDQQLVIAFVTSFFRATGKGFTSEAWTKVKRDFTDPFSLIAMYLGFQTGFRDGVIADLKANIVGLAHIAKWLFWNATPVGIQLQQLQDAKEWVTDPKGKAAREKEKQERQKALLVGMAEFAVKFAKDPGIIADLGEEVGQAAGEYVAEFYGDTIRLESCM